MPRKPCFYLLISWLFLSRILDIVECQCVMKNGILAVFPNNIFAFLNSSLSVLKKTL